MHAVYAYYKRHVLYCRFWLLSDAYPQIKFYPDLDHFSGIKNVNVNVIFISRISIGYGETTYIYKIHLNTLRILLNKKRFFIPFGK